MNRVQGEEKFYRVNLRLAGWVGGVDDCRINSKWEHHGDFDSPQSKAMQKVADPFMVSSKLNKAIQKIESSPTSSPWL